MFEVALKKSDFSKIVNALRLVDEAVFQANAQGVYISEMEPAKVAMVIIDMHRSAFDMYNCDKDVQFKVSIDDLKKIAKLTKGEYIRLLLDEINNRLQIHVQNKIRTKYIVPLIDFEPTKHNTPTIIFKAKIKTIPEMLQEIVTSAKNISDYLEIEITREHTIFRTTSLDREMEAVLDSDVLLEKWVEEPVKSVYPLLYLQEVIGKYTDVVTLELSTNMPMRLLYESDAIQYTYYIAPRREQ